MQTNDLSGKKALVTGASSGIGRQIALDLVKAGAAVALTARREERLHQLAEEIGANGGQAIGVAADFSDETQIASAVATSAEKLGGLDVLINSAGVAIQASLAEGDSSDWRTMLDVNVLGTAIANREVLKHFDPKTGGHIVNICSMSGHRVPGKGGFYAATKFAVRAMTEGLRQELRQAGNPTRVSQVSPGFVDTELLDIYFAKSGADRYAAVDYEMLKAEDVSATVLHILTAPEHMDVTDVLLRPAGQKT